MRNRYAALIVAVVAFILLHSTSALAQTAQEYFERGIKAHREKKFDEALTDYTKVIELRPDVATTYFNRALIYRAKKNFEDALADLNKAIEIDPKMKLAYLERSEVHSALRKNDLALADVTKAIEIDPKDPKGYYKRADLRTWVDDVGAINDFTKAIELDPKYQRAYIERGSTYGQLKQDERALADFQTAIALDPAYYLAYSSRGLFYKYRHKYDLAIADFSKAIDLSPDHYPLYAFRAETYFDKGIYDIAIAEYTMLIERDDSPMRTWHHGDRAKVYRRKGDYELAISDFKKSAELDPKRDLTFQVALTYLCANKNDLAYQTALSYRPEDPRESVRMAEIGFLAARRLKKTVEANSSLERWTTGAQAGSQVADAAAFLKGKMAAEEYLAKGGTSDHYLTEAHLFVGETMLSVGKPASAKIHFEWVRDNADDFAWERDLAIANLRRLSAAKSAAPARAKTTRR